MKPSPKLVVIALFLLPACNYFKLKPPTTVGDVVNAPNYGYTPVDPLPVTIIVVQQNAPPLTSLQKLKLLPDETIRIAIRQISGSAKASYGPAKVGFAGSDYEVVLDYVSDATENFPADRHDTATYVFTRCKHQ